MVPQIILDMGLGGNLVIFLFFYALVYPVRALFGKKSDLFMALSMLSSLAIPDALFFTFFIMLAVTYYAHELWYIMKEDCSPHFPALLITGATVLFTAYIAVPDELVAHDARDLFLRAFPTILLLFPLFFLQIPENMRIYRPNRKTFDSRLFTCVATAVFAHVVLSTHHAISKEAIKLLVVICGCMAHLCYMKTTHSSLRCGESFTPFTAIEATIWQYGMLGLVIGSSLRQIAGLVEIPPGQETLSDHDRIVAAWTYQMQGVQYLICGSMVAHFVILRESFKKHDKEGQDAKTVWECLQFLIIANATVAFIVIAYCDHPVETTLKTFSTLIIESIEGIARTFVVLSVPTIIALATSPEYARALTIFTVLRILRACLIVTFDIQVDAEDRPLNT